MKKSYMAKILLMLLLTVPISVFAQSKFGFNYWPLDPDFKTDGSGDRVSSGPATLLDANWVRLEAIVKQDASAMASMDVGAAWFVSSPFAISSGNR